MTRTPKHARHPVESLLRLSVYAGETPDRAEVDALNLPALERRRFDAALREALALRSTGERQQADTTVHEAALGIIDDLPERLQHPGYNDPDPTAGVDDPAELAAIVTRNGGGMAGLRIPANVVHGGDA